MKQTHLYFALFFFGSMFSSFAQDGETTPALITDRPGNTEAAATVPIGSLQIETGAYYTSFEKDELKLESLGYNGTVLRYGILKNLEMRLAWSFEEGRASFMGDRFDNVTSGFSPLLAGVKVGITEENGLLPTIGFVGYLVLPFTASTDYRPENTGVDFTFAFNHTLSENSSLAYNLGAEWGNDSPEAAYTYTLLYGYSISDRFGAFAEIYGDFPEDNKANHLWDAGITYLVKDNLQLDAAVGTSITEGQDLLVSVGLSYRIPK